MAITIPGYLQNNMKITYSADNSPISDAINVIGETYVKTMKTGTNILPLAGEFVRNAVPFGKTIRTLNITIPNSKAFDSNATDEELKIPPTVKSEYADLNYAATIPLEMHLTEWNPTFENAGVDSDFRTGVYQSINERMNLDMYNMAKKRVSNISSATGVQGFTGGFEVIDMGSREQADYEKLLLLIKQYITKLKYPSTVYNKQGVLNAATNIIVVVPDSTMNDIDSKVMSKVFGPDYIKANARFVTLDDFDVDTFPTGMTKLEAVVMDSQCINYHPRAVEGYDDPQGRRSMHFIGTHIWGTWRDEFAMPAVAIGSGSAAVAYTHTGLE